MGFPGYVVAPSLVKEVHALSLGFVVGFFDLIPLVGATLGAVVVSFATLRASFSGGVSVLVGASLLGILGALLAIPTAAAIQIVLRDWWAHRTRDTPTSNDTSPEAAADNPPL
jgi:predicted PurR-regulated permease PerM